MIRWCFHPWEQLPLLLFHTHPILSAIGLYSDKESCTYFQGAGGACVKKTNQALIIGIYDEPMTPGQCNMIVERLGDYLIDQGL